MSDYKEVEISTELTNKNQLIRAIEALCGMDGLAVEVKSDVVSRNKWNHTRRLSLSISEDQLPSHLQGYGDVGFELKGGKYVPIGISEGDSHYIDNAKGLEVGTFTSMMNSFFGEIANTYTLLGEMDAMAERVPGIRFGAMRRPAENEDPNAMGIDFEIDSDLLARMGVHVPA